MNRRAVFTGGSALALLAFTKPASAVACAEVYELPDAEIIRLGEEHDRLRAAWVAAWHEWQNCEDEAQEAFELAGGGDYKAWFAFCATHPAGAASDRNDEAIEPLQEVDRIIRTFEPKTLAGWLVRLRVERDEVIHPRDAYRRLNELDWEQRCLSQLHDDLAWYVAKGSRSSHAR